MSGTTTPIVDQWASLQMQLEAHRPMTPTSAAPASVTTPVIVLGGFLGVGKTTLLVKLLSNPPQGLRIRAIVNDVGSLPFDPSLVELSSAIDVQLSNGCGCCQINGDLAEALDAKADSDVIVLEASGLADPYALAQVVEARPDLHVDRIVTVVDALGFGQYRQSPASAALAQRQLDAAHAVIITKLDGCSEAEQVMVTSAVSTLAAGRPITGSTLAHPAVEALLPSAIVGARLPVEPGITSHHVTTLTLAQVATVSLVEIEQAFARRPKSIARTKGRLDVEGVSYLVQSTATEHSISPIAGGVLGSSPAQMTVAGSDADALRTFAIRLGCAIEAREEEA